MSCDIPSIHNRSLVVGLWQGNANSYKCFRSHPTLINALEAI